VASRTGAEQGPERCRRGSDTHRPGEDRCRYDGEDTGCNQDRSVEATRTSRRRKLPRRRAEQAGNRSRKPANQGYAPSVYMGVIENASPVYHFISTKTKRHFCTISEEEKYKLLDERPSTWKYQGIAFFAYAEGHQPKDARPVYRFRSESLGHYFYTMDEATKDMMVKTSRTCGSSKASPGTPADQTHRRHSAGTEEVEFHPQHPPLPVAAARVPEPSCCLIVLEPNSRRWYLDGPIGLHASKVKRCHSHGSRSVRREGRS